MKQIKAIIRPEAFGKVKEALKKEKCNGIMVTEVQGHGQQGGVKYQWRGEKYEVDLLPKVSIEIVVKDEDVDRIVKAIITSARTGEDKGEGKIFVYNIERAIRIRTGEEGDGAI
ncbi:MAG: P-II family nitrogen regulator [Clostridiales bacterium]|jgi:nitrogen regulatory protein P-II 1|nr:P-II family nitrogen regulator [Clostridiales bacterium]